MEIGFVRKIDIDQEMQQAYLDYAMSVIVARALPDARDGLKPVHRRILYAMYDMGIRPDSAYKKSARIVGEVLGKYHPHGDTAVYEAMARMAQDFSMRYLLVDGQGNFGSVDGDPPAAMRYTEARLALPAMQMLQDIEKNTIDFSDNFDATLQEPNVLPAALPNLLVNGATGIAVGMATSIPPHNLCEVCDALVHMLENWEKLDDISVEELMRFIKGPDFPTGGVILQGEGEENLTAIYGSGRGRLSVQARAHLEEMERGRNRIIVSELPYMTNKSSLIERIAELAREGKIEGIVDLRDESDRHGMRIVIELSKTADPEAVLRDLYRYTPMQTTFSVIMLALVEGEPRLLSLKQSLRVYLEHRLEVVRRRSEYELNKARHRAHILEGLRLALKHLDEIIELIRRSPDADTARSRLIKRFRLTDFQAQAILDMPLKRLAALERKKIEEEYQSLLLLIKELEVLLRSPKKMRAAVADELKTVRDAHGDRRRTHILKKNGNGGKTSTLLTVSDLTPEKTIWLTVSGEGLIARTHDERNPRLSGKEAPLLAVKTNLRHTAYLVNERGEAAAIPVHIVPEAASPAEGAAIDKISPLPSDVPLAGVFCLPPRNERPIGWFLLTISRQGMIKKSALEDLPGPSARSFPVVKINPRDRLGWLLFSQGKQEILLATALGMAIRFHEEEVRPMGLAAAGVTAMKLADRDELAGADLLTPEGQVLLMASDGYAKRMPVSQFPLQRRYGQGVIAVRLSPGAKVIGLAVGGESTAATIHFRKQAARQILFREAPLQTRAPRGLSIVEIKPGDGIVRLSKVIDFSADGLSAEESPKPPRRRAPKAPVASSQSASKAPASVKTGKAKAAAPAGEKASSKIEPTQSRAKPAATKVPTPPTRKGTASKALPKTAPISAPDEKPKASAGQSAKSPPSGPAPKPGSSGKGAVPGKSIPPKPKPIQKDRKP